MRQSNFHCFTVEKYVKDLAVHTPATTPCSVLAPVMNPFLSGCQSKPEIFNQPDKKTSHNLLGTSAQPYNK